MNVPNPLIPQGSMLEQQSKGRSRIRLALFIVVAAHVVFLGPLLIQGCKPESAPEKKGAGTNASSLPPIGAAELAGPDVSGPGGAPGSVPPATTGGPGVAGGPADLTGASLPGAGGGVAGGLPATTESVATGGTTHKVVKGDTLGGLAAHYHVPLRELLAANPKVNPTRMQENEVLTIPTATASAGTTGGAGSFGGSAPRLDTGDGVSYKVKAGDSLTKIAKAHGTTVKAIQSLNGMKTTTIQAGKMIKLPKGSAATAATTTGAEASTASLAPGATASVR